MVEEVMSTWKASLIFHQIIHNKFWLGRWKDCGRFRVLSEGIFHRVCLSYLTTVVFAFKVAI